MTLIMVGRRRCAATCYDAEHERCRCVCDGRNHGVGQKEAVTRTLNSAWQLVRHFGKKARIMAQEQMTLPIHLPEVYA